MQRLKGKFKRGLLLAPLLIILTLSLISCSYSAEGKMFFGTFFDMRLKGEGSSAVGEKILKRMSALENALSTNISSSDISKINSAQKNVPVLVSTDTIYLLKLSKEFYEKSDGAFNPALFPVVELWNMSPGKYFFKKTVPAKEAVLSALSYTDFSEFIINEQQKTVTKKQDGAKLDLGAIAKGYAADEALKLCGNLKSALINAGGTITYLGGPVKIAIADPRGSDGSYLGTVNISGAAVATSGDYERYFELDGVRYHHIFDQSGYPAGINEKNPIISVTIIAPSATIADALSTTLFILGKSKPELLSEYGASAIIVYKNKTFEVLGDIDFTLINTEYAASGG